MSQPPRPLSAEEEAELRRVAASWPEVSMEGERATQFYSAVRRLLATLDAAERVAVYHHLQVERLAEVHNLTLKAMDAAARDSAGLDPCPHCDMEHVWPCPTIPRCDEPGCDRETSCGFPTDAGYRRTCGDHYRAALSDPKP